MLAAQRDKLWKENYAAQEEFKVITSKNQAREQEIANLQQKITEQLIENSILKLHLHDQASQTALSSARASATSSVSVSTTQRTEADTRVT